MDVSNAKNPFLFDDPGPTEPEDVASNPFLNGSPFDYSAVTYSGINPFSDQIDETTANAMNIFGDQPPAFTSDINPFGDVLGSANPVSSSVGIAPAFDIFGSTVPPEPSLPDNLFGGDHQVKAPPPRPPSPAKDFRPESPSFFTETGNVPGRPPPPRPPPPSKETKDLLQTVIGAMEATTDTLQDKLNTTRTPCPSPGNGTHGSRSPTPDIQITAPDKGPDAFSAIFGQTIELSDQEIDENQTQQTQETKQATPAPPAPPAEEIDLFGEPIVQSKPKTTQDILSLFNKPKETEQQFDLLSGDLLTDTANEELQDASKNEATIESKTAPESEKKGEFPSNTEEPKLEASPFESEIPNVPQTEMDSSAEPPEVISEVQIFETPSSPEQISEKSDTEEPTVIETNIKKSSISEETAPIEFENNNAEELIGTESDQPLDNTFISEKTTPASIFDAPFDEKAQITPPEPPEMAADSESPDDFPPPPPPLTESPENFGLSSDTTGEKYQQGSADSQVPISAFDNEPLPVGFGTNEAAFGTKAEPAFGMASETTFGTSETPFGTIGEAPFGTTGETPFGTTGETPFGTTGETPFGTTSEAPFGTSETAFGTTKENISEAQYVPEPKLDSAVSAAGLFGDVPAASSTETATNAFDLFGANSSTTYATPGGGESTGAALFESTPAPNVGMSLFGGGQEAALDIFAESESNTMVNPFAPASPMAPPATLPAVAPRSAQAKAATDEEFDAFSARFEGAVTKEPEDSSFDPFGSSGNRAASPWGDNSAPKNEADAFGFGDNAQFDAFLSMNEPPPVPQSTPRRVPKQSSGDSDEGHMSVVIKPANQADLTSASPRGVSPVPVLAPPPAALAAFADTTPRFNPFDRGMEDASEAIPKDFAAVPKDVPDLQRSESQETPPTPLFEEDQSVPLEPFLRIAYDGRTWEMYLRQPNKKKITGQRFWKKIYVKLTNAGALQLFNNQDDKEPFQELPLQPSYSVSDIGAQQFDQFGKIFTVKLQYIFYKERPGVRPGQISKAERITTKLSKFAQYAIAGDYEGVKEFASDVRKLGMPVEHAPQISQLLKLGTQNYEDLKLFASLIEEFMFKLTSTRDRALTYKTEEVQLTAVDELYVEQDLNGAVTRMLARVRIFFLGFLSGMPEVDLGINDLRKQGHEVVGRHDIIPIVTEEWIRLEDIEFHNTVNTEEFDKTRHIKFKPPDGCYIELMRFRVRPPKNRELPLRVKTKMVIQGRKVEINCEILVPGFSGRKLGQVPCEDVAVRFPLPECWIYMFRVEKHFRYGSVKSAHRRTGKVKGIERIKGAMEAPEAALMEVTSGQAKYEHQHRAIVWRVSRLPKEGQGAYSVHQFSCKMHLTDFDQMPESLDKHCVVEFTMPATTVSHCVMRSVSVTSEDPPEKYVRYLARHEYRIEIEFSSGSGPNEYIAATMKEEGPPTNKPEVDRHPQALQEESSSDESS